MSPLYLRSNCLSIWQKSFEPYLDPTQWPPYNGPDNLPDPTTMKTGKGRRKKKRLKGDMDAMRGYGEDMYGGGTLTRRVERTIVPFAMNPVTRLRGIDVKGSRFICYLYAY